MRLLLESGHETKLESGHETTVGVWARDYYWSLGTRLLLESGHETARA